MINYETEFDPVFVGYVRKIARNFRLDSDDLVQEVALKILSSDGPRSDSSMGAWKWTIARNTAITMLRQRDSRAVVDGKTLIDDNLQDKQPGPLDKVIADERADILVENVRALSDMDFQILNEYYCHGKSTVTIAEELGITFSTAKRRLHVARRRLAKNLTRKYGEPDGE